MKKRSWIGASTVVLGLVGAVGCMEEPEGPSSGTASVGEVGLSLQVTPGFTLDTVNYVITGPAGFSRTGSVNVSGSNTVQALISSIPAGTDYSMTLSGSATQGNASCNGSATFNVIAGQTSTAVVPMTCHEAAGQLGSVLVNGSLNICATLDGISASPGEVLVGGSLSLRANAHDSDAGPQALAYLWSAPSGIFSDAQASNPTFKCVQAGSVTLSVSVSDGDPAAGCTSSGSVSVICTGPGGGGSAGSGGGGAPGAGAGGMSSAAGAGAGGMSSAAGAGAGGAGAGGAGASAGGAGAGGAGAGGAGAGGAGAGGAGAGGAGAGGAGAGGAGAGGAGAGGAGAGGAGASGAGAGGAAPTTVSVFRVGDGSAALTSAATAVFIDTFTTSGTLVGTVPLPTAVAGSNRILTSSGVATSDGEMTLSADGHFLIVPGYDATVGTSGVASFTGARVAGRVSASGQVNTTTAVTDAGNNNNRSVASVDGTAFWLGSAATGVRYALLGATTSTQISTTVTNVRQVGIFNSQLYVSDSSGSASRLGTVGTGLPTTSGQTIVSIPGFPASTGSPYGFFFADLTDAVAGLDTLYVADDGIGITKYSLVSSTWASNGTVGASTDLYRGLTAKVSAGVVTLYATGLGGTGATGGGKLVSLSDASGYNGAFTGTPATLVTAANQTAFRGVALAPQ